MMRPLAARRSVAAVLASFACVACNTMMGPSPERIRCLNVCAHQKDACMLNAMDAATVQACDAESQRCGDGCEAS